MSFRTGVPASTYASSGLPLAEFVRRLLCGKLSPGEATRVVAERWKEGSYLRRLPVDVLPTLEATAPSRRRYCCSTVVRNHVLYGTRGEPGCVLVIAPYDAAFKGNFHDLNVPMHVHETDHIAVVMDGEGVFYVQRDLKAGPAVVYTKVGKGCVLFFPAGTPHTFAVGRAGISVATFEPEFEFPDSPEFATFVPDDLHRLPHVEYRDP